MTKAELKQMIRECLQEELANGGISSEQDSLVEGIFDKKKDSAEYKNSVADFDSEVSKLTKGKDLNDVAYDLANLVSSAASAYKVKAKRKDNHQTHDANLDRDFSVHMDDARTFAAQKLKGIQKAANFAAVGYAVEQIINRILGDFASETDIPGKLQKYTDVLPSIATIQADKAVKQDALKNFAATVIREVNDALANLDEGLQESINEAATGFRLSGSALLSVEDLADAVYRDNDPDAIKKYASSKDIKDVTVEDLAIAAENSDLSREIKYLAAHLKNKGVATIGEFAATLTEALNEDVDTMDWDTLIDKADEFLYELIKVSGNADYDDGDGYWSGEEGHIWTNRYLYYTGKLNDSTRLAKLCDEYSRKLPNVVFYYTEDDFLDDPISEIGYEATNVNW